MIKISTPNSVYDTGFVHTQTSKLMAAMGSIDCSRGIGVVADISLAGVLLSLATIRLGLRTAICSTREPAELLDVWLRNLGITSIVSSHKQYSLSSLQIHFVDDILESDRDLYLPDLRANYVSMLRTSGTTALPKTAGIGAHAHQASARSVCEFFSFTEQSSWALCLPLFHVSGLAILFRALHARATVFLAKTHEDIIAGIENERITHISLVPTQLRRLLDANVDLSKLHAIIMGGDAVPATLRARAVELCLPLYETYGLTETASMVWAYDPINNRGGLLPHARMMISDEQEILVGGQSLFDGYVVNDGVDLSLNGDGFFKTGDLGFIHGCELHVQGRMHHRIISGGENIQAEELERILEQHPFVELCVITGIADTDLGMRPCAIIKWRRMSLNVEEIAAYLKLQIASYKIPKTIFTWPEYAPVTIKKPRLWLQHWLRSKRDLDKSVIVGA